MNTHARTYIMRCERETYRYFSSWIVCSLNGNHLTSQKMEQKLLNEQLFISIHIIKYYFCYDEMQYGRKKKNNSDWKSCWNDKKHVSMNKKLVNFHNQPTVSECWQQIRLLFFHEKKTTAFIRRSQEKLIYACFANLTPNKVYVS